MKISAAGVISIKVPTTGKMGINHQKHHARIGGKYAERRPSPMAAGSPVKEH
ncbi:MAG: hypothetical protein ACLVD8_10875 [Enterocloster sp.]|uniref:hypothetical protein n=1 Tax=Enterocloster sp. TaxID=2719315 RepID=UPI00399C12D8